MSEKTTVEIGGATDKRTEVEVSARGLVVSEDDAPVFVTKGDLRNLLSTANDLSVDGPTCDSCVGAVEARYVADRGTDDEYFACEECANPTVDFERV